MKEMTHFTLALINILFYYLSLTHTFGCILFEKNFGQLSKEGRSMRKINIPRVFSQRPSGLCVATRPHQILCGNATSHEYRTDRFRVKTGMSNHVTAGVETTIMNHVNSRLTFFSFWSNYSSYYYVCNQCEKRKLCACI